MEEGRLAVKEENVVITAGGCSILVMPALGGKISSLRIGPHELLHAPLNPYGPRNQTMGFAEGDASGWDECLPSVAECSVTTESGIATVPDHGDLWRVPWQVIESTEDSITLRAQCFSLPLELTRSLILSETSSGWKIRMLYSLVNLGDHRVLWAWTAHPLFACEEGDRIVLPSGVRSLRLEDSRGNRLGVRGDEVTWPMARVMAEVMAKADVMVQAIDGPAPGEVWNDLDNLDDLDDLSRAHSRRSGRADKLFAGPMREGWSQLERAAIGLRIKVGFDPAITPYLGLWLCYGGWPEGHELKQVCVALEPATAPVDSLAETGDWSRWLDPGVTVNWPMEVDIERLTG
jgi:galactose mutarotase-like enzyme